MHVVSGVARFHLSNSDIRTARLVILKAAISQRAAALGDVKDNVLRCFLSAGITPELL